MEEPLTITSLRVDEKESEGWNNGETTPLSYLIVNVVFKCKRTDNYDTDFAWSQAKGESEDYRKVLTIDDPKRYEEWLVSPDGWEFSSKYDGYGRAWIHGDPPWRYIEKFDCFWFREWVASCSVTKSIINELAFYKSHGRLPSVYRAVDSCIILSHLRALQSYWD